MVEVGRPVVGAGRKVGEVGIAIEVALLVVLIVVNGLFSMSETAVVSSRRPRLQQRAEAGDVGARRALALAEEPNVFLATVQIGITLVGILSGAFGGAALSGSLADLLGGVPGLGSAADPLAFAIVVLVITYLSLVVGELVPKRIALNDPEAIAGAMAGPMRRLATVVAPVVRLLGASTDAGLRVLRVRQRDDPPITEEEVGMLLEQGARAGVFDPAEREMVEGVFGLADDRVTALMTPRPDVVWLDVEGRRERTQRTIVDGGYSRFPVCQGELDRVLGVARAKDLLAAMLAGKPVELADLVRPALLVPESTSALRVLERFRESGEHMALIVDEYGGIAGLITVQDVLEAIVGDLPAGGAGGDREAVRREDGSWLLDGGLAADDLRELLGLPPLPGEAEGGFETLAGFVLAQTGRVPAAGDGFAWGGWRFEVLDMDGNRVDKVLATPEGNGPRDEG